MTTHQRGRDAIADLPMDERLLIQAALNALNSEQLSEATDRLYVNNKRRMRATDLSGETCPPEIEAMLITNPDADRPLWQDVWTALRADFRGAFRHLMERGRLSDDDLYWLGSTVQEGVVCRPEIKSVRGRAQITIPLRFATPSAAVAYVLLKLSSMRERIVICKECGVVKLDTPHRGPPSRNFCSKECRQKWHSKERTRAKRKQGEGR